VRVIVEGRVSFGVVKYAFEYVIEVVVQSGTCEVAVGTTETRVGAWHKRFRSAVGNQHRDIIVGMEAMLHVYSFPSAHRAVPGSRGTNMYLGDGSRRCSSSSSVGSSAGNSGSSGRSGIDCLRLFGITFRGWSRICVLFI
jgi:hypothetical protein